MLMFLPKVTHPLLLVVVLVSESLTFLRFLNFDIDTDALISKLQIISDVNEKNHS